MKELLLLYICRMKNKYKISKIRTHVLQCAGVFIALIFLVKTGDLLHTKLLIAPFGASCVILFGFPHSHFSQPKNIIGGYFICSLIGVAIYGFWGTHSLGIAFAVSLAVLVMLLTNLMHPPAGAVTIIAITSGAGWMFILVPVAIGAFIIVTSALLYNKIHSKINKNFKEEYQDILPEIRASE
jgi:CBS-domain-containing membrane protein